MTIELCGAIGYTRYLSHNTLLLHVYNHSNLHPCGVYIMTGADDVQRSSLPISSESTRTERHGEPPRDANFGTIQAARGRIIKKFNA